MSDVHSKDSRAEVPVYHNPNPPKPKAFKLSCSTATLSDVPLSLDDIKATTQLTYAEICQLNLFALILYRANHNGYEDFGFATEVPHLEKLDEMVFVGRKGEKRIARYIQAKYGESGKTVEIRMSDLKSKYLRNDFSILRYFKLYLEIKRRCNDFDSALFNFEFDGITIVTNKSLSSDVLEHFEINAIRNLTDDKFLYIDNQGKSGKYTVKKGKLYDNLSKMFREEAKVPQTVVDEFFQKFHLFLNYPRHFEMERLLETELREIYNIFDSNAKLNLLRMELYDWLTKRTGTSHTYKSVSELFGRIDRKILGYEMYSINKSNLVNIPNEYTFQNDHLVKKLEEFLGSDSVFVLELQFDTIGLARMRTVQAFEQLKNDEQRFEQFKIYTHQFGHILINTKRLLNRGFLMSLKQLLQDEGNWNLIIVELDDIRQIPYDSIISHLRKLHKKVILISKSGRENSLASTVRQTLQVETNFSDLEADSQVKLLKTENAIFQDTSEYIDTLIGDQNKHLIEAMSLDDFVFGRNVKIGIAFPSKAYIESNYIKRRLLLNISVRSSIIKNLMRASFVDNAFYLPDGRSLVTANDVIVISHSKKDFENAVEKVKSKNFHWFNESGDKLIWMQSKGSISELASYRNQDVNVKDESLRMDEELLIEKQEKIVIISGEYGTGKSTLFGSLAKKIKETQDPCWTIRIDLLDYSSFLTEKAEQEPMHLASSSDNESSAVSLLIELLRSSESNEPLSVLEERLLGAALQRQENDPDSSKQLKVALFVDQFSEINLNLRNFVLKMLVELKSTEVHRIFVSTRPTTRSVLEVALGSFAYELEPFSKADRLEFLEKRSVDNEALYTLGKRHGFYGTPLYLEIVSKIDADRLKALDTNCIFDIFAVTQSFRDDTQKLYERVFQENFSDSNPTGRNFDLTKIKSELSSILTPDNPTSTEFQSIYADYSLVNFLGDCFLNRELSQTFCEILMEEFLQRKEHSFIRTLLNSWWGKYGGQIPSDSVEKFSTHFSSINDQLKRKVFGTILKDGCREIFKALLKAFPHFELSTTELTVDIVKMLMDLNPNSDGNVLFLIAAKGENLNVCEWLLNSKTIDINLESDAGRTLVDFALQTSDIGILRLLETIGVKVRIEDSHRLHEIYANICKLDHRENFKWLFQRGMTLETLSKDGSSLLHVAAKFASSKFFYWLVCENNGRKLVNVQNYQDHTPLHVAIDSNNLPAVKVLIENGADFKFMDENGYTILHFSACVGDRQMLSYILNYCDDINCTTKHNQTALHIAASNGNFEAVKVLIENNVDVSLRDGDGYSTLDIAVLTENIQICAYLLQYININSRNSDGNTPLLFAATENKFESLKFLIESGANLKAVDNDGWTVLHKIAKYGNRETCSYVLDKYKDINVKRKYGETPLHLALWKSNIETVKVLIENGADVTLADESGCTVWHYAASAENTEIYSYLLNHNREINVRDKFGRTPLLLAAEKNKLEILKFLIENGADMETVSNVGWTILHIIAQHGNRVTCSYVLDKYKNINVRNSIGITPLQLAVCRSNVETVKVLIENGADVTLSDKNGWTVWHRAALAENTEICSYLLNCNREINVRNKACDTPLFVAAYNNKLESLKFLIENGADVKAVDNDRLTVLHKIAQHGNRETCSYVLDKYKDINVKKKNGATPLHVAIWKSNIETVKVLIENRADVTLADEVGWTVWHYAADAGNPEICLYLLNRNREINARNKFASTPLLVAAEKNKLESLKFLIGNGTNMKAVDNGGWTILHKIAQHGNRETCSYVLDKHKDINIRTNNGLTPLHVAIWKSNIETVKVLIENGADVTLADEYGWTVWHRAASAGNPEICSYLLNRNREINARNNFASTPLLVAAEENKFESLKFLIENGADVKAVDNSKWTILHLIALKGNRDTCSYVLDKYKHINARNIIGMTPLHAAVSYSNLETVKVLIENGADVTLGDENCWTAMHYAARAGNTEIGSYLLNSNRQINVRDNLGNTPLLVAAEENKLENLKFLIENGADMKTVDNDGWTVLHKIAHHGNRETCSYVLDKDKDIIARTNNG